jgi:hypothetical protein
MIHFTLPFMTGGGFTNWHGVTSYKRMVTDTTSPSRRYVEHYIIIYDYEVPMFKQDFDL